MGKIFKIIISGLIMAYMVAYVVLSDDANQTKFKITNINEYIYKNLNLSSDNYEFVDVKANDLGEVIYAFQLYKAKGTLLVYVNIPANTIGHRVIENLKVPQFIAFNNKAEIMISTVSGENKYYYISSRIKQFSFDNPSYNLSNIVPSNSYFYWFGYQYNENKRVKKQLTLFRYKYNTIQKFNINDFVKNLKKRNLELVDFKPLDKKVIFRVFDKKSKQFIIYVFDLSKDNFSQVLSAPKILYNQNISKDVYFSSYYNRKVEIMKYNENDDSVKKIMSIEYDKVPISLFFIEQYANNFLFSISFAISQENFINMVFKGENKLLDEKTGADQLRIYYLQSSNKVGYYYLLKDSVIQIIK